MARTTPYLVPTDVLADQGAKVFALYVEDSSNHKQRLEAAGLPEETFQTVKDYAEELLDLEITQEERKMAASRERAEASAAVKDVLRWRLDDVLSRARVIFDDDPRLVHFRSGQLRSQRPSAVVREARLLIEALKRFRGLPEAKAIGLDRSILEKGQALLENLVKEDTEDEVARALQIQTTAELREKELELSNLLANIEKRAPIAFPSDHPGRRRYRMNEIRQYVSYQRGPSATDPSADVLVEDPAPEPTPTPVDA